MQAHSTVHGADPVPLQPHMPDCLPAFHDTETEYGKEIKEKYGLTEMEVTDEVFRSKYARQFEEAENRMHSIKAIMAATLGNLFIPAVPEDFK